MFNYTRYGWFPNSQYHIAHINHWYNRNSGYNHVPPGHNSYDQIPQSNVNPFIHPYYNPYDLQSFQPPPHQQNMSGVFPGPNNIPYYNQQQMQSQQIRPPAYSLMSYFQNKDGQLDVDKMLTTVGKLSTTVQQVSPLFKSLGSILLKK